MKKKMSNRDKKILLIFGAILIVAASYFLVFTKMSEKKSTLVAENATLQQEVSELEAMKARETAVKEETADYQELIGNVLSQFPPEVRTQNAIYDLHEMYTSIDDVKIQSESYNMNQIFYQQGAVAAEGTTPDQQNVTVGATGAAVTRDSLASDVVSAAANYTGYRSDVAVAFTAPYSSVKKIVNFINDSEDRMTITDISATKDAESELLTCSMTVSMYAISGSGEYEAPEIDAMKPIGENNSIFDK